MSTPASAPSSISTPFWSLSRLAVAIARAGVCHCCHSTKLHHCSLSPRSGPFPSHLRPPWAPPCPSTSRSRALPWRWASTRPVDLARVHATSSESSTHVDGLLSYLFIFVLHALAPASPREPSALHHSHSLGWRRLTDGDPHRHVVIPNGSSPWSSSYHSEGTNRCTTLRGTRSC